MSTKKIITTIIVSLIITVSAICIIFFNIDHGIKKVFVGYKYTSESDTFEETVVTVNGRVNYNIFNEDDYEFQIKIEGEESPFDGRHLAQMIDTKNMDGILFYPEYFGESPYIEGGMIKTNKFKDYVILVIGDYRKVVIASTKHYEDINEMIKALDCENLFK